MTTIRSDSAAGLVIDSDTSGALTLVTGNNTVGLQIDSDGKVDLSSSRFILPVGNNSTRANVTGALRFNNESNVFEAYNGNIWLNVLSPVSDSSEYSLNNPYGLHLKDPHKNIYRLYTYDSSIDTTNTGTISGIEFNNDGTRMFLLNQGNDRILEFYIAEGWNVANARYTGNIVTLTSAGDPHDLVFKPDGTKLYVASRTGPVGIVEYSLSTPWNINTISLSNTFVTSAQETAPYALDIGDNGNVFYIYGQSSDTVYEYRMGTAWNLSTASYSGNSYALTIALLGDPPGGEDTPYNVFLSDDGTYLYTHGIQGDFLALHTLSTPWNLSTASFTKHLIDFSGYPTSPFTIRPAKNGEMLFMVDITDDTIVGYTANNPWGDFGIGCLSLLSIEGTPFGIYIKPDGTKLYVAGTTAPDRIHQLDLTIPYDIGTATYAGNISFSPNTSFDSGFTVSSDGNHFFVSDIYNAARWTMTTPWDVTSAGFTAHRSVQTINARYYSIEFNNDGTRSYGGVNSTTYESDIINQFSHPPYDIANAKVEYAFMVSDVFGESRGFRRLRFNEDGTKVYILFSSLTISGTIEEYSVQSPYNLYTANWKNPKSININRWFGDPVTDLRDFNVLNGNLYFVSASTDAIQQIRIT